MLVSLYDDCTDKELEKWERVAEEINLCRVEGDKVVFKYKDGRMNGESDTLIVENGEWRTTFTRWREDLDVDGYVFDTVSAKRIRGVCHLLFSNSDRRINEDQGVWVLRIDYMEYIDIHCKALEPRLVVMKC